MRVIRIISDYNNQFDKLFLISASCAEIKNLCEGYNQYGNKIGCYNAGCFSPENSAVDFDEANDVAEHTEEEVIEFWNGSNWNTLILDEDYEYITDKEEKEILSDFREVGSPDDDDYNNGVAIISIKKYNYTFSRYAGFEICGVERNEE